MPRQDNQRKISHKRSEDPFVYKTAALYAVLERDVFEMIRFNIDHAAMIM